VRRFTLLVSLAVVALGLVVSFTPLYDLIVRGLMDIPEDVAALARPTLQVLSLWPLSIGWRRSHQGVLIRAGQTTIITAATGVRLLTLVATLLAGMILWPHAGAVVAGLAMNVSVLFEAVLVTAATSTALRRHLIEPAAATAGSEHLTLGGLVKFYRPLIATSLFRQCVQPILSAGIAAAVMGRASLAAWPVAWGLATLITGPAWSLQQLSAALSADRPSFVQVARFSLGLSAMLSLLLAGVAFTPLYELAMGEIYNLSTDLQTLARPAVQLLVLLPILQGSQSLLRGALIRGGSTGTVRTAMILDVLALVAVVLIGVHWLSATGVIVAAAATVVGGSVELIWLYRSMT
jgi:hypothetical protein